MARSTLDYYHHKGDRSRSQGQRIKKRVANKLRSGTMNNTDQTGLGAREAKSHDPLRQEFNRQRKQ